ncbi:MAG: hypothetical protein Q9218_000070 [Villophora microphyllina]
MTREATLLAKHEELQNCIQTRNSVLLELYRSTAVLANIQNQSLVASDPLEIDFAGEQSFLKANDLSLERFFHSSTLPSTGRTFPHAQKPVTSQERNAEAPDPATEPLASASTIGNRAQSPPRETQDTDTALLSGPSYSSEPDHQLPKPNVISPHPDQKIVSERTTNEDDGDFRGLHSVPRRAGTIEPPGVRPLDTATLSADDAPNLPDSALTSLKAQSRPDGARTVHLPPENEQEERLNNTNHATETTSGADLIRESPSTQTLDVHPKPDTFGGRKGSLVDVEVTQTLDPSANGAQKSGNLELRSNNLDVDAVAGDSPLTPDKQPRPEEARSFKGDNHSLDPILSRQASGSLISQHTLSGTDHFKKDVDSISRVSSTANQPLDDVGTQRQETDATSQRSALRNHAHPGITGDAGRDITFSQRPPMRIDTGLSQIVDLGRTSSNKKLLQHSASTSHTPPDSATTARVIQTPTQGQSPPERMTTRVSSGALRHKSVSEILGETPKPLVSQPDKAPGERSATEVGKEFGIQSPRFANSNTSPDSAAFRIRLNELKEKDKSKLSTVIFARKHTHSIPQHTSDPQSQELQVAEAKAKNTEYFLPLFNAQAATPPQSQLLNRLIGSASKTLTTANHFVEFHEQQDCRILSRIQNLQNANRWSLRQLERSAEPERPTVHWDVLLSQMKWLRTDFREERKWKRAAASCMASWCAQWVAGSKEERVSMQVKVKSPPSVRAPAPELAPTPDLIPSAEDDSSDAAEDEVYNADLFRGNAPAAIFTMAPEMFYFGLQKTPVTDKLLHELPLYQPSALVEEAALCQNGAASDTEWRTALAPVSKFNEGNLTSHDEGPPRKRSRYDYTDADEVDRKILTDATAISEGRTPIMQPEQNEVALFNPENKHIRDRIHAGHAFRPPSEFVMPSQSFFESRHSSQWTQGEDDELRRLVREYAYNWSLIASCLSVHSVFSSGAERRTPWECFERWIGLEGLPAEMAKTAYFRTYHARLQAAQSIHEAQQQAMHQQQGSNAPLRRRNTQPFLVERRKNTKHVHLVNAMRNLARKREATAKKQEEAAELAAMRKATQPPQPRHTMQTPQEFSRLKHERELRIQEQQKIQRMQYLAQQKAMATQRAGLQPNQHPAGASLAQSGRNAMQAIASGTGPVNVLANGQVPSSLGSQARPPQTSRPPNGVHGTAPFPPNQQGIPHAPMQPAAHMPGPTRVPPQMASDSMRVYQEATRVQAEQQRFLQQQRQQQQQQPNGQSSPNISSSSFMPPNGSSNHTNLQGRSASPSMNGVPTPNGSSSSPRMNTSSQSQALSSGMMPAINQFQNHLRTRNPNATQEQISQMATDRLKQFQANHSLTHGHVHAAMQAAAGGSIAANSTSSNALSGLQPPSQQPPPTAIMNGTSALNMQQYNQNLRNHQQHQQNRSSGTPFSVQRPASRGATPQIHRTSSAQADPPHDSTSSLAFTSGSISGSIASKPFSVSFGTSKTRISKSGSTSSSSSKPPDNPRKRPHSSLNADSDSDTEDPRSKAPQLVSAFDHSAGGAISVNGVEKAKEPLVIQGLKNRDWREESRRERRGKNLLPAEVQQARQQQQNGAAANGQKGEDVERNEVGTASGLTFVKKDEDGDTEMTEELRAAQVDVGAEQKEKTVDEEALEALMGGGTKKSTLVVPAVKSEEAEDADVRGGRAGMNEDDHFRSDVASRPDPASLDDYARVPVEEFGLGMLRGMGWKEGEVVGKRKDQVSKARVVERRPALLGIGAKEVSGGVGDELGAWGKVTRGKKKPDKTYNPVVLKNSRTGEMLTEEELQAKKLLTRRKRATGGEENRGRSMTIEGLVVGGGIEADRATPGSLRLGVSEADPQTADTNHLEGTEANPRNATITVSGEITTMMTEGQRSREERGDTRRRRHEDY